MIDDGAVAQLGERLNGIQEVRGSNPLSSTSLHQAGWYRGGRPFVPDRRRVFCYSVGDQKNQQVRRFQQPKLTPMGHIGAGVVGACLLDSLVFNRAPTAETLALAVGLSLIPDLDAPVVAALRGNWPLKRRNGHHTAFTHTPLFYLAMTLLLAPFVPARGLVFFGVLTMLHLALDSWATDDGIMWLWPHTDTQYALLPVPIRDDEYYGWRYYRYHYVQKRKHAVWAEIGFAGAGLIIATATLVSMPGIF
jgi:hypothetical protein